MPKIELLTQIKAPIERVFDLCRSIDLHTKSMTENQEKAVAGVTSGLIGLNQEVTWSATHFGVRQTLSSRITAFDRPRYFRDSMIDGAFKRFDHDHFFTENDNGTLMRDVFDYDAPWGPLGWVAEQLFLTRYMRNLLASRNTILRRVAESEDGRCFLS